MGLAIQRTKSNVDSLQSVCTRLNLNWISITNCAIKHHETIPLGGAGNTIDLIAQLLIFQVQGLSIYITIGF